MSAFKTPAFAGSPRFAAFLFAIATLVIGQPLIAQDAAVADAPAADTGSVSDAMSNFNWGALPSAENPAPETPQPEIPTEDPLDVAPPETETETTDDDPEPKLDPNGKTVTERAERMKELYANHKAFKQIQDFAPTVEAARQHYEESTDFRQLNADFQSADPARIEGILGYFGNQSPEGLATMADRMPEFLARTNPQVYEALQSKILNGIIESNYERATASDDPEAFHRAQMFEWTQRNAYRQPGEVKAPDPLAKRQAELDARENALKQSDQQRAQVAVDAWRTETNTGMSQGMNSEIETLLKPILEKAGFTKPIGNMLKSSIFNEATQAVKNDKEWLARFNIEYGQALKSRTPEARQAVVDSYMARVRNVIRAVAKPLVDAQTKAVVTTSQQQHQRSQAAAGKVSPGSSGKPIGSPVLPPVKDGATMKDKMDAFWKQTA